MAISHLRILVVIATIFLPTIALAEEFVVGDDHGWTTGFDYKAWAADKTFQVGDKLGKLISSQFSSILKNHYFISKLGSVLPSCNTHHLPNHDIYSV